LVSRATRRDVEKATLALKRLAPHNRIRALGFGRQQRDNTVIYTSDEHDRELEAFDSVHGCDSHIVGFRGVLI